MATTEASVAHDERERVGGVAYDGFISYSHAADGLLAQGSRLGCSGSPSRGGNAGRCASSETRHRCRQTRTCGHRSPKPSTIPGRYDFWVEWRAPCSAWTVRGVCPEPDLVVSLFASSVNMPFYDESWTFVDDPGG